jgi:group I intron endonuclease
MKDNELLLEKIIWYDIDESGYIKDSLKNKPAIYIYKKSCGNTRFYVGSSMQLATRISSHRCSVINWGVYKDRGCPILYKSVLKYGWNNFKFGVLENIDIPDNLNSEEIKKIILDREQYYLDNVKPSLNASKTAGSNLGVKHDLLFSKNLSKSRRGIKINSGIRINIPKNISPETRLKLSSRVKGISVRVFDKSNNLIYEFPSITSVAKHFNVDNKTISNIFKIGISYDDYIYKFKVKDNRVWIYDLNHKYIKVLDNIKKASEWSDVPANTLSRYIKSGKLYKDKYYFYNINSNPY